MPTKREILAAPNSALNKAADDEPIFVLRAQDLLAPPLVDLWSELAAIHGADGAKVDGALDTAGEMRAWHGGKKWPY